MKHYLISLLFLSASFHVVAQETLQTVTDNGNHTNNRIIVNRTTQFGSRFTAYGQNLGYFDVFNNNNNSISLNLLRSDGAHVFGIDGHSMDSYFGGKLGLGTAAPLAKLDIRDGHVLLKNLTNTNGESVPMIMQSLSAGNYTTFGTSINSFTESGAYNAYALQFFTQDTYATGLTEKLRISANGNVGVGIQNPTEALDVNGNMRWNGYKGGNVRALNIGYSGGNYGGIGYNIDYTTTSGVFNRPLNDQTSYLEFTQGGFKFFGNENQTSVNGVTLGGGGHNLNLFAVINSNGDFGIGTATPKEKLSVNGKIRAHEVKVETANWPDYVFEEGYQPKTLKEIDEFIKFNKHLPEVPSAKEVAQNGIELGEMNKILLKKIEELTLHLIAKDKKVEQQDLAIKALSRQMQELQNLIKSGRK